MESLRQIAAVILTFGLLGGVLLWLRSKKLVLFERPRSSKTGSLAISERLRLTPQHTLFLVQAGGRELLVAAHSTGCTLLDSRDTVAK